MTNETYVKITKKEEHNMPIVGTKVIIDDKYPGFILRVYPPNEDEGFSGRFIVRVHYKHYTEEREFWFHDYGVTVKEA